MSDTDERIYAIVNNTVDDEWVNKYPIMKYTSFNRYKDVYNDYLNLLSNYVNIASTNIRNDSNEANTYRKILDVIQSTMFTDEVYISNIKDCAIRFVPLPFDQKYNGQYYEQRYVKIKTKFNNKHNAPYYVIFDNKYNKVLSKYPSFHNVKLFELSIIIVVEQMINLLINHIDQYHELREGSPCNENLQHFCQMIDFHDTHSSVDYKTYTYKRLRRMTSPGSFGLNVTQSIHAFRLIQQIEKNVCFPTLFAYRKRGIGFKIKWMGKGNFTYLAKHSNLKHIDESGNEIKELKVDPYWKLPIYYEYSLLRCKKHNVRYIVNFISHLMKGFGVHSLPQFYAGGHINCLLIDLQKRTLEIYEPFGLYFKHLFQHTQEQSFIHTVLPLINRLISNVYGFKLTYISTYDVIRNSLLFVNKGVQYFAEHNDLTDFNQKIISHNYSSSDGYDSMSLDDDTLTKVTTIRRPQLDEQKYGKIDYVGYCGMWSLLYAHLRINTTCSIEEVLYFINRGIAQRKLDLIRNYTAFIENKMSEMVGGTDNVFYQFTIFDILNEVV